MIGVEYQRYPLYIFDDACVRSCSSV